MERSDVQGWLDKYIAAWRSNDRAAIEELFSDNAVYRYRPYGDDNSVTGRDAIVASWLEEPDAPENWDASYEPYAVDGDRAVAIGTSWYAAADGEPEKTYVNAFLLRFDPDGRCSEFTEYYMREEPT
jgi:ketosteroid isomerase-like protein